MDKVKAYKAFEIITKINKTTYDKNRAEGFYKFFVTGNEPTTSIVKPVDFKLLLEIASFKREIEKLNEELENL